jgi:SNF2 family DNA or RNA helicase
MLRDIRWDVLVIDEAQGIKNPFSRRSTRLREIPRKCAISVTGTPVENHLMDLWAIMEFSVPLLLGPIDEFEKYYPDTISGAETLEPIITPLILRRRVSEVAKDLPSRIDIPQPLELDVESARIYEELRLSVSKNSGDKLSSLIKLRMYCTHPWLIEKPTTSVSAVECSVKLQRLMEIIEEIIDTNGKALIFTSYQESVDMISREISNRFGIYTDQIDGRVPIEKRQEIIDKFSQQKNSAVLVLNPKAAGTGLNITAANHVIHFNLEWNPAVEDQASARAHRRGQTKTVTVHRFFYINTVEEIINERMRSKRQLSATAIIGGAGEEADMGDILRALQISPIRGNI